MAPLHHHHQLQPWRFSLPTLLLFFILLFFCVSILRPFTFNVSSTLTVAAKHAHLSLAPTPINLTITPEPPLNLTRVVEKPSFDDIFSPLWGDGNLERMSDQKGVRLKLDEFSGSGFISSVPYHYGVFSADIKLPSNKYTAGIVVAFYMSNEDRFPKRHDELDFEFLGDVGRRKWKVQTNAYCNGSVHRGREERYYLWFDPSKEFHRYSIVWSEKNVVFYVDEVPIRVMRGGENFPSKPMSVYTTLWDGSGWATSGGKYKVQYKYAPFVSEFRDFDIQGCAMEHNSSVSTASCSEKNDALEHENRDAITPKQRTAMKQFRQKYVYYSYCYDRSRYDVLPPECDVTPGEEDLFTKFGRPKTSRSSHPRRQNN